MSDISVNLTICQADCNTGRSGYGCLRIIDGDYDNDNNYINNSSSSEATSHLNSDMNSVLFDLEALPSNHADDALAATTTTTATNANDAILTEVENLSGATSVEEVQTQWTSFTADLVTKYPGVFQQIAQLNSIVSDLTTLDQWNNFFDLVKEKIIQLQATASADSASSTTHTNSKEDLEWLFAHRNSHDNQATWQRPYSRKDTLYNKKDQETCAFRSHVNRNSMIIPFFALF